MPGTGTPQGASRLTIHMNVSFNSELIRLTEYTSRLRSRIASRAHRGHGPVFVEGIDRFCGPVSPRRRALLSLLPSAWQRAAEQYPDVRVFNIDGLTIEVVRALNRMGYVVDIVDYTVAGFCPSRAYNLYMGHGGHTRTILDQLSASTFVLHYASGAYWAAFNQMSQERYDNFRTRKGLTGERGFVRSLDGTESGEEYLARRADATFLSGPRTAATFDRICKRMCLLYLGAYVDESFVPQDRDFEEGRQHFIYVAGTSGNIQKGLDLLLEVFARMPSVHLYVHCKVDGELLRAYRSELARPNIHYTYHYEWGPLRRHLRQLLRRANFTITAPIDSGPGTAFIGSMALGLVPVGYADIEGDESDSVLTDSYSIDALVEAVQRASSRSAEWCREASRKTSARYQRLHAPSVFGEKFGQMLANLGL